MLGLTTGGTRPRQDMPSRGTARRLFPGLRLMRTREDVHGWVRPFAHYCASTGSGKAESPVAAGILLLRGFQQKMLEIHAHFNH